jgi:2-polyprenyl-3-methyl-5-hydroxy-6-metoxy-1,4-benzoquinol methylase
VSARASHARLDRWRTLASERGYTSGNLRKHVNRNPAQRLLIDRFLSVVGDLVAEARPSRVLDVGCGEGFTADYLRDRFRNVRIDGIDLSADALRMARAVDPRFAGACGSAAALPFAPDAYDLVLCNEVLEHVPDPPAVLAELRRVARAHCVLSVPHEPWFRLLNFCRGKNLTRLGNDIEHLHNWTATAFANLVSGQLTVVRVERSLPWTLLLARK